MNKKIKVYRCNPKKNKKCDKKGCYINGGLCRHTGYKRYAKFKSLFKPECWEILD